MSTELWCVVQTLAEIREEQRDAENSAEACVICKEHGSIDSDGNPVGCLGGHPVFAAVLDMTVRCLLIVCVPHSDHRSRSRKISSLARIRLTSSRGRARGKGAMIFVIYVESLLH